MRIYKVMTSEGDWGQPLEELLTFAIMRETDKGMSEGFRKSLVRRLTGGVRAISTMANGDMWSQCHG